MLFFLNQIPVWCYIGYRVLNLLVFSISDKFELQGIELHVVGNAPLVYPEEVIL